MGVVGVIAVVSTDAIGKRTSEFRGVCLRDVSRSRPDVSCHYWGLSPAFFRRVFIFPLWPSPSVSFPSSSASSVFIFLCFFRPDSSFGFIYEILHVSVPFGSGLLQMEDGTRRIRVLTGVFGSGLEELETVWWEQDEPLLLLSAFLSPSWSEVFGATAPPKSSFWNCIMFPGGFRLCLAHREGEWGRGISIPSSDEAHKQTNKQTVCILISNTWQQMWLYLTFNIIENKSTWILWQTHAALFYWKNVIKR